MACSTRPYLLPTMNRESARKPTSTAPVNANSPARMPGVASGRSSTRLKSVKPLLPPKPVSLRKKSSIAA